MAVHRLPLFVGSADDLPGFARRVLPATAKKCFNLTIMQYPTARPWQRLHSQLARPRGQPFPHGTGCCPLCAPMHSPGQPCRCHSRCCSTRPRAQPASAPCRPAPTPPAQGTRCQDGAVQVSWQLKASNLRNQEEPSLIMYTQHFVRAVHSQHEFWLTKIKTNPTPHSMLQMCYLVHSLDAANLQSIQYAANKHTEMCGRGCAWNVCKPCSAKAASTQRTAWHTCMRHPVAHTVLQHTWHSCAQMLLNKRASRCQ